MDRYWHGKRVSYTWYLTLVAAQRSGLDVVPINSGRRTMGEQWYLYRNQPPLAAYPSPNAPHIRVGRETHAIDINCPQAAALIAWLRRHGIACGLTVRGECWHIEILTTRANWRARIPMVRPILKPGDYHSSVQTMKFQLRRRGYHRNPKGEPFAWLTPYAKKKYTYSTKLALQAFQRRNGLRADGVCGPATWAKLLGSGV